MKDFEALEYPIIKQQIATNCCFSLGREYLMDVTPSYDILWIKRELARSKEALDCVVRYGSVPLLGLHDVSDALADAKRDATLRAFELRRIASQHHASKAIVGYYKSCENEIPCLEELFTSFGDTKKLCEQIEACINGNDEVMDHASAHLSDVRRKIRMCVGDISKEVQRFIQSHGALLMDTITTTRNDRICVSMKVSEKNSVRGFVHGESASGQTAYVEPESLLLLNNKLQSLKSQEQEEIERILFELSQAVKGYANVILANQDTFALLDMTFAKANWAFKKDGCFAEIEEHGTHLLFEQARHPLIDEKQVVANTYEIKAPYRSLLITGSNTGGKTVTLKTIGLFACMTQSGMPVCAQTAIMPFFSQIFVDIGDDQSIQESLSTFSSHVSKLAYICDHVSESSLVLLDELGSGTDPKEGESLAVAVLGDLRMQKAYVVATTHYSALKSYAKQSDDVMIASVAFDVETMRPTYVYQEGISGASNALAIARRYHMNERVLAKAKEIQEQNRSEEDVIMEKLEAEIQTYQSKRNQVETTLADVKQLQAQLLTQKNELEASKTKAIEAVKLAYTEELEQMKAEASAILQELKDANADVKPHVLTKLKHDLDQLGQESEAMEEEHEESFVVGDYVCLKKLNYYGELLELQKDKATVLVNGLKMKAKLSDLTKAKKAAPSKKKEKGYHSVTNQTSFSMELNVIGMTVQEAIPVIDKYLDNAMLAKVFTVRLIHGMGTGALRNGIHTYLKKHPKVEAFRMGGQGEGGLGASVVTLKSKGK